MKDVDQSDFVLQPSWSFSHPPTLLEILQTTRASLTILRCVASVVRDERGRAWNPYEAATIAEAHAQRLATMLEAYTEPPGFKLRLDQTLWMRFTYADGRSTLADPIILRVPPPPGAESASGSAKGRLIGEGLVIDLR